MTHTPKPWTHRETPGGFYNIVQGNSGATDSNVIAFKVLPHNVPVIEAAPEMLEAAEAVVANWEQGDLAAAVRKLAVAIRKAGGVA